MAGKDIDNLLCIHLIERVGTVVYQRLLDHFGDSESILTAKIRELGKVDGVGSKTAERIARARGTADVEAEMAAAERLGLKIVTHLDDGYPLGLKVLRDHPLVIYIKGELRPSDSLGIGVVGSRRATQYGISQANRLAGGLAGMGVCVVSGLARGIDGAAHRAALRAGGRTIAVVGNGLGKVYPPEHRDLAEEIAASGAVISELPIAVAPAPGNFPPRNRIISALSVGLLVIEAARRSGAMITAKWANEQGKPVFAVPGPIDSPVSRGPHQLIRDGAKLVESGHDIVAELGPLRQHVHIADDEEEVEDGRTLVMSQQEKRIFALLSTRPTAIDDIIEATGLAPGIVNSTLMVMEIKRWVRQLAGKRFVRA